MLADVWAMLLIILKVLCFLYFLGLALISWFYSSLQLNSDLFTARNRIWIQTGPNPQHCILDILKYSSMFVTSHTIWRNQIFANFWISFNVSFSIVCGQKAEPANNPSKCFHRYRRVIYTIFHNEMQRSPLFDHNPNILPFKFNYFCTIYVPERTASFMINQKMQP